MIEEFKPPTDNLYKFLAIGGLALAIVAFVFFFRELSKQRERWVDAQVELLSNGYAENSGVPSDPAIRPAYFRRQFALREGTDAIKMFGGTLGTLIGISLATSIGGFVLWWWRVQRHEDAILQAEAKKVAGYARDV